MALGRRCKVRTADRSVRGEIGKAQFGGDINRLRNPVTGHHVEQGHGWWSDVGVGR